MSEEKKTRKKLTTEERLEKIEQQKINALKQVIKDTMGNSPKFLEIKDAYLKSNKWLHEAKLIVASYDEVVAELNQQLEELKSKYDIAKSSIATLESSGQSYSSMMQTLGEQLAELIKDQNVTSEQLTAKAEELLVKHSATFKISTDPFLKFRKKD